MPIKYSQDFKEMAVQKLLSSGARSVDEVAKQLGISTTSMSRWAKNYGREVDMDKAKKSNPQSWSAEMKLQAIIETSGMDEQKFGEYLRKHGLHSNDIKEWKEQCLAANKPSGRPQKDPEILKLRKDKRELEKDLRRKDTTLAEMSARIVLLKKSRLIWGENEDDE